MALANSSVPGYIVIGATDDGGAVKEFVGLTEQQVSSFDPSKIANKIRRYSDPEVKCELYKPKVSGLDYVVIRVFPFIIPHICTGSCGDTLNEAAIYVRGEGARTIKVQSAEQMRQLVNRAIQIDADNLIARINELIVYTTNRPGDRGEFESQRENLKRTF